MKEQYYFHARDVEGSDNLIFDYELSREVKLWLSRNLRKRAGGRKRYNYLVARAPKVLSALYPSLGGKQYAVGVYIYNEDDAMAFKLRWG